MATLVPGRNEMRRELVLTFLLCFAAIPGFAQDRLNGKWATDKPANPNAVSDPLRRSHSVQLELSIEDGRASGALALGGLGGRFITFKDAKVSGDKFQFRTTPENDSNAVTTWAVELVDDNTALISHDQVDFTGTFPPGTRLSDITGSRLMPVIPPATATPGGGNGSLSGTVRDSRRANIPGVTVTATNVDTGLTSTATTDETGAYEFPGTIPGKYTVTASLPGFNTSTVSDLSVGNSRLQQDLTLEIRVPTAKAASGETCSQPHSVWCAVLHRAK
jgi:hypothetical protein